VVFSSYEVAERSVSQGVLSWDSSLDSRLSYVAYVVVCFSKTSKVMRCQKCQKGVWEAFGTFGTPSFSVFGETTRPSQSYTPHEGIVLHPTRVCIREFYTSINYGHIFRIRL
jgi:hypothetical protein